MQSLQEQLESSNNSEQMIDTNGVQTNEERQLRLITKDFTLNLNQKDVAMRIRDHPLLSTLQKEKLVQIKRNALKRRDRLQNRGHAYKRAKRSQEDPGDFCEEVIESGFNTRAEQESQVQRESETVVVGANTDRGTKISKKLQERVLQILRYAAKLDDSDPLVLALISCVAQEGSDNNPYLKKLLDAHDEKQSKELQEAVQAGNMKRQLELANNLPPQIVVWVFEDAAKEDDSVLHDQQMIEEVLIPSISSMSDAIKGEQRQGLGAERVLRACTTLLADQEKVPDSGIFVYAHSLNRLYEIFSMFRSDEKCKQSLSKAFAKIGFTAEVANAMGKIPEMFCHSLCVTSIQTKTIIEQKAFCRILSLLQPAGDPSAAVLQLSKAFKSRLMLRDILSQRKYKIPLTVHDLVRVVQAIIENNIERDVVKGIFAKEPHHWLQGAQMLNNSIGSERLTQPATADAIYAKYKREISKSLMSEMTALSQKLHSGGAHFAPSIHQNYIAAKLIASQRVTTASVIPTGTGKTFICALIHLYYSHHGMRSAIVTSEQYLVEQAESMLGSMRQELEIVTMAEALKRKNEFEYFIIDEADECFCTNGVFTDANNGVVTGFWDLIHSKCILLTATIETQMQEILFRLFKVKITEYLDFTDTLRQTSAQMGHQNIRYSVRKTVDEHSEEVLKAIAQYHQSKPLLIFVQPPKMATLVKNECQRLSIQMLSVMNSDDIAGARLRIRSWDRGVCVVNKRFIRGTDLRFNQDSLVIGAFMPESMQEVVQMTGRSSRSMKTHESLIIAQDTHLDAKTIAKHLELARTASIKDAITAAKIVIGKHASGDLDDRKILGYYTKGWQIMSFHLRTKFNIKTVDDYISKADELIEMCADADETIQKEEKKMSTQNLDCTGCMSHNSKTLRHQRLNV